MKLTYNLLLTDADIVHECVQTDDHMSDETMCGHETRDLRKEHGPTPFDDNLRVVKTPVTCIDCIAVTDEKRQQQLAKARRAFVDFYV